MMPISRVDVHYCNFLAWLDGPFPIGLMLGQVIDIRRVALPLSKAILSIGRIAPAVLRSALVS
jgi:hypothetical protein